MKYTVIGGTPLREVGKNGNSMIEFHMLEPLSAFDRRNGFKGLKVKILQLWNPGKDGGVIVEGGNLSHLPVFPFELDVDSHVHFNREYIDMITIGKTVPNMML